MWRHHGSRRGHRRCALCAVGNGGFAFGDVRHGELCSVVVCAGAEIVYAGVGRRAAMVFGVGIAMAWCAGQNLIASDKMPPPHRRCVRRIYIDLRLPPPGDNVPSGLRRQNAVRSNRVMRKLCTLSYSPSTNFLFN